MYLTDFSKQGSSVPSLRVCTVSLASTPSNLFESNILSSTEWVAERWNGSSTLSQIRLFNVRLMSFFGKNFDELVHSSLGRIVLLRLIQQFHSRVDLIASLGSEDVWL